MPAQSGAPGSSERAVVRAALLRTRRVTGLPVAFAGVIGQRRRELRLTELSGTTTEGLRNLIVAAGNGLGGRVLSTARPASVDDYALDTRITHDYDRPVLGEGLRAIAAAPAVVGAQGNVHAIIYAGIREPLTLGTRVLDALREVTAGLATELAVRQGVDERLQQMETAALMRAAREAPTAGEWERIREAHAELRAITQEVADPELRRRLLRVSQQLTRSSEPSAAITPLAPREVDVLALVAIGCTNAEIAHRLGLLPETVKSYLRGASRKLGSHTRTETVAAARRHGFLP